MSSVHTDSPESGPVQEPEPQAKDDSRSIWMRLLFMLIMGMIYGVTRVVLSAIVVLLFFWVLFTGKPNPALVEVGDSLAIYTYQIVRYLTFNTERCPFPIDDSWPPPSSKKDYEAGLP